MFEQLIELQNKKFQSNIEKLNYYCEKYPDIKTFIELVLADRRSYKKLEDYVATQLIMFMYDLGYTIDNYHSEINFDLQWSSTLISFIGNYFLDDAYFNLKQENGRWRVYADFDTGIQDPMALVNAARENAKYYWDQDNRIRSRQL